MSEKIADKWLIDQALKYERTRALLAKAKNPAQMMQVFKDSGIDFSPEDENQAFAYIKEVLESGNWLKFHNPDATM